MRQKISQHKILSAGVSVGFEGIAWTISEDGKSASIVLDGSTFRGCENACELEYGDSQSNWIGTEIFIQYDAGPKAEITGVSIKVTETEQRFCRKMEETAAEMESEAAWQQGKEAEDAESFLKAFFSLKPLPEEAADQKNESMMEGKESSAEADNDSAEAEAESTEASGGAADAEEKNTETDVENAAIDVDEIMQNYVEYYTAYYEEAQLTPYLSEKGFDTLVSKRMPQKYQRLMEEGTVLVEDVKLLDCEARLFVGGNLYTYEVDLRLDGKEAIVCVDGQLMMDADGKVEDLYVNETEEFLTLLSGVQQEFTESAAKTESE